MELTKAEWQLIADMMAKFSFPLIMLDAANSLKGKVEKALGDEQGKPPADCG